MSNEEIVALTGMCIRSVRDLRKVMEEQVWAELDIPATTIPIELWQIC